MKVAGEATLHAPIDAVWDALLDPAVLVRTIPGCEKLEAAGENAYAMQITAGVASIKGTYAGTCELNELVKPASLVMKTSASGAPGTVAADVKVDFTDNGDGTTGLRYGADAIVGGMIGGVGQRMLASVSKRMAGEFFVAVNNVLTGHETAVPPGGTTGGATSEQPVPATSGQVFTAPAKTGDGAHDDAFLKGVALGGGLVALGVLLGALAGRRRG
ncbi:SRPBCC family protein [Haloechinothrix halophila]|uniref:SRPBCC family protein n=1 Tax=Haloechinothrix halophila TaxID=1069073 RepID=UPI00042473A9|nr:carbon monoxide dehydrogenase subunit G [Haloechinothrix halophila]